MENQAAIEFYQFVALMVVGTYVLGAAILLVIAPFVIAWSYLGSRRSQPWHL